MTYNSRRQPVWVEAVKQIVLVQLQGDLGLVEDPDNILSEQVLNHFHALGWLVLRVTDPLTLRYEYESRIRNSGDDSGILLLVPEFSMRYIPYDIQSASSIISLSLKQFFPGLSYNVLCKLPSTWQPVIFSNQPHPAPSPPLKDRDTALFVLEECLGISLPSPASYSDLVGLIADQVLHDLEIPTILQDVLIHPNQFQGEISKHLSHLLGSAFEAREFLQNVWAQFMDSNRVGSPGLADHSDDPIGQATMSLSESPELQTKMTALVAQNILPLLTISPGEPVPSWFRAGLHYHINPTATLIQQLGRFERLIPGSKASAQDWLAFAEEWSTLRCIYYQSEQKNASLQAQFFEAHNKVEDAFLNWLLVYYPILLQQPYLPYPTAGNQVLHYLAAKIQPSPTQPVALIVVDGMSLEDWQIIRSEWNEAGLAWQIEERATFSIIPTITSVSRQSLLSGRLPRYFETTWLTTDQEEFHWRRFWEEHGLQPQNILYLRGLGKQQAMVHSLSFENIIDQALDQPHMAVGVFIVNTVDDLVHASLLGPFALHNQISLWARTHRYLQTLVSRLLEQFAVVAITSDHGHIEGQGVGDLPLGQVASEKALRVRIFQGQEYRNIIQDRENIMVWKGAGLPDQVTVIIPKRLGLFTDSESMGISHGGASLEEVIVPFVTITK